MAREATRIGATQQPGGQPSRPGVLPAESKARKWFDVDVFSPPMILGATYLALFGIGIIDVEFFDARTRLRTSILYFRGVAIDSLVYLLLTYGFFLAGYFLSPAAAIARHIRPAPRQWLPHRTSVMTTAFFLVTFAVLIIYTITVGYGRYGGTGDETLANLSLLGELSLIPLGFSLVRYGQFRAGHPDARMSRWDRFFLWGVMFPAQALLSVIIGVRVRAFVIALMPLAAYHYTYKRLRVGAFALVSAVLVFVMVPVLGELRSDSSMILPEESSSYSVRAWHSVAGHASALETYTVIYENRERVPEPDPIHWALLTGLVPRFLWPSKPQYTFNERLTVWAVGSRGLNWMGPTLPGELIMLLGYVGALAFMALLGGIWRILADVCLLDKGGVWLALYIVVMRTLLSSPEVGFILPYATMTRYVIVTVLMVFATTVRVHQPAIERHAPAGAGWPLRRAAGV